MALNFPNNPTVGDLYAFGGSNYRWSGSSWDNAPVAPQGAAGYTGSQGATGFTGSASVVAGYAGSQGEVGYTGSASDATKIIKNDTQVAITDTGTGSIVDIIVDGTRAVVFSSTAMVPNTDQTYDLGSPTLQWKDVYVGPGSLYVNGQKVLQEDAGNIVVSCDINQNLIFQSSGSGNIELTPTGSGLVSIKGTLQVQTGNSITTSDGSPLNFGGSIVLDAISSKTVNNDLTLTANGTGNVRVDDNLVVTGNFTVSGSTTTINTQTLSVADNIIDLNSDVLTGTPTENAGIRVMRGDSTAVQIRWNEANDQWEYTNDGTNYIAMSAGTVGYTGSKGAVGYTGSASSVIGFTGSAGTNGTNGYVGSTGSQGVIGFTGSAGTNGTNGTNGYVGSTGSQGVIGFTGSAGYLGSKGFTGSQGVIGFTGSAGTNGYVGSTGSQGVIGFTGSAGYLGSKGFTGSQGIQGVIGFTGSASTVIGYTGSTGSGYVGSQGATGYTGSKGIDGYVGSRGYTGSAASAASQTEAGLIEIATNAEVAAGTDTTRAITPAGLFSTLVKSHASTGYQKLPNGLIMQWGSWQGAGPSGLYFTFPVSFPNACLSVACSMGTAANDLDGDVSWRSDQTHVNVAVPTTTGFEAHLLALNNPGNGRGFRWIAIGY